MKICNTCKIEKSEEDFHLWKKDGIERRPSCKICVRGRAQKWHSKNSDSACARSKINRQIRNNLAREFIIDYLKENPCHDCGNDNVMVLEFDHVSLDKKCSVAHLLQKSSALKKIKEEIAKCEVVCANCHRIRTYTRNKSYRYMAQMEINKYEKDTND